MLEKLAKFRMRKPHRSMAGARPAAPANDNRLNGARPDGQRRPRLICRWTAVDGRLACRWETEHARAPAPTQPGGNDPAGAFHKPVFVLSYQPKASGLGPRT